MLAVAGLVLIPYSHVHLMNKRTFWIGLVLVILLSGFSSQVDWFTALNTTFSSYHRSIPQEQFGLHLDRASYSAGDTAWVAVVATAYPQALPDTLSKTIYLELLDPAGKLNQSRVLSLINGRAAGHFELNDSLYSGTYSVRATTSWMRNFGAQAAALRPITIINSTDESFRLVSSFDRQSSGQADTVKLQVQLFQNYDQAARDQRLSVQLLGAKSSRESYTVRTDAQGKAALTIRTEPSEATLVAKVRWESSGVPFERRITLPAQPKLARLAVLPEGGELVSGLSSRVAFLATDAFGNPLTGEVALYAKGSSIPLTNAPILHKGMGALTFTPEPSVAYDIELTSPLGKQIFSMPKAHRNGAVMRAEVTPKQVRVVVFSSDSLRAASPDIWLGLMQHGRLAAATKIALSAQGNQLIIPTDSLATGSAQVTLVSNTGQPLAERLVFVQANDTITTSIESVGEIGARKPISLTVSLKDAQQLPLKTKFSVSVTDVNTVSEREAFPATMRSDLLLQSALSAHVPDLSYYLIDRTRARLYNLDLLMMVYGWRRFTSEAIVKGQLPQLREPIEKSNLTLSGQLLKGLPGKPEANKEVQLIILRSPGFLYTTTTDKEGRFTFSGFTFPDTCKVVVKVERPANFGLYTIKLDTFAYQKSLPGPVTQLEVDSVQQYKIRKLSGAEYQLSEVVIRGQRTRPKSRSELWGKIYSDGVVTSSVDFTKLPVLSNITSALSRLPGVRIGPSTSPDGSFSIQIRGVNTVNSGTAPLIYLDGTEVDAATIATYNPLDIDHVDLLSGANASIYGSRGSNGVLLFYSRRGFSNSGPVAVQTTKLTINMQGFASRRKFFSPDYSSPSATSKSDFRQTLYWNPEVVTDENGQAHVKFYQTDYSKRLRVVIQGMSEKGIPFAKTTFVGDE